MERETGSRREAVRQAAALWVVRLGDPSCSAADRAAFEAWRDESHENEAAFEREAAAWARLDRLRAMRPGPVRLTEARPDRDLLAPERRLILPRFSRSPWARGMAAVTVAAVVGAGVMTFGSGTAYATAIGERRVVVLSDNSRIELNTDSKVVVRYRKGVREVKLVRGEAVFEAAKDARPFVIKAADAVMQADAGAEMAVRLRSDGAAVTVKRGAVALDPEPTERKDPVRLTAGVAAIYSSAGHRSRVVSDSEIDRALAWRQGAIALNGAPALGRRGRDRQARRRRPGSRADRAQGPGAPDRRRRGDLQLGRPPLARGVRQRNRPGPGLAAGRDRPERPVAGAGGGRVQPL